MKRSRIYESISIFSCMFLVAFSAVYFYSPVVISHAASESSVGSEVNLSINPSISLSVDTNEVSMNANINSFVHDSVNLTVITNSQFGYTLSIEDADSNTNMVHEDSAITDVVSSNFTGSKTSSTMDDNTWGWSSDNGSNYYRIPEFGVPTLVSRLDGVVPNGTATATVDFGINVGLITSGTYSDTILFTAYANGYGGLPKNGTGISAKGTKVDGVMQNFNCSTLASGNSVTLKDSRDNNTYNVTKLADGKCWMTQNLRIAAHDLTSDDTEIINNISLGESNFSTKELNDLIKQLIRENPNITEEEMNIALGNSLSTKFLGVDSTYGGYYAPITVYGGVTNYSSSIQGNTIGSSICPKGWRLPTMNEFETLGGLYGSLEAMLSAPVSFQLAGYFRALGQAPNYYSDSADIGSAGMLVTSSLGQSYGPQVLYYSSETVQFNDADDLELYTVRCIAR